MRSAYIFRVKRPFVNHSVNCFSVLQIMVRMNSVLQVLIVTSQVKEAIADQTFNLVV